MERLLLPMMTALLLSVGTTWAGPLENAEAAYERGDYATALTVFRPLATQGNASAQYRLGFMYFNGQGVVRDSAESQKWYRLAAAQGHAGAQNDLGARNYQNREYLEALNWYRLAAAQGYASAQHSLGLMYANGFGVVQDYVEAAKWY